MPNRSPSMGSSSRDYSVVLSKRVAPSGRPLSLEGRSNALRHGVAPPRPGPRELARPGPRAGPGIFSHKHSENETLRQSFFAMACARVLVALLTLQPIYVARGMEIAEPIPAQAQMPAPVPLEIPAETHADETEASGEEPDLLDDASIEAPGSDEPESSETVGDDPVATTTSEAPVGDDLPAGATTTDQANHSEPGQTNEPEESALPTDSGPNGESGQSEAGESAASTTPPASTSTPPAANDDPAEAGPELAGTSTEQTASSSEDAVEPEASVSGKYVFGEGDCTIVSEDEFYCFKEGAGASAPSGKISAIATLDREGDREIYLVGGQGTEQITNNSVDDFAPTYDPKSGRIAWHSMVEDRLKVMLFDPQTGITQLSDSSDNSSNPHVAGDAVAWQEWIGDNWEIILADDAASESMERLRLTDNDAHDMFPQVYGEYVTWQRKVGAGWEVIVYDLRAEKETSLEKIGDGRYENPRFMLLMDRRTDEGDIETVGYDMHSGEAKPLSSTPKEKRVPVLPTDETGEAAQGITGGQKPVERRDGDIDPLS